MGLRFKDQTYGECFFITTSFYEHRRLGETEGVYEALADSLRFYLHKYHAQLPGYVFMPSHIHLLLFVKGNSLAGFMRDFKKYVAQKGVSNCGVRVSQLWAPRYDRVVVYSETVFHRKLEYIHRNPVTAGLVLAPEEWQWSSAGAYLQSEIGCIPVWKDWLF